MTRKLKLIMAIEEKASAILEKQVKLPTMAYMNIEDISGVEDAISMAYAIWLEGIK